MLMKVLHPALLVLLQAVAGPFDFDQAIATGWREVHQVGEAAAIIAQVAQNTIEYDAPVKIVDALEREPDHLQIDNLPVDERIHQALFLLPTS